MTRTTIVYSPDYDIHYMGLEKLHPFDSRKFSRAWNAMHAVLGDDLDRCTVVPPGPASPQELLLVHSEAYLEQLQSPDVVLRAIEIPSLPVPDAVKQYVLRERVLRPMALATKGTMVAAEAALKGGEALNLSGGYHHASAERGEGFCIYADVAITVAHLRQAGRLLAGDRVAMIDVDAHQGNGVARILGDDEDVCLYDVYNRDIYPQDRFAEARVDVPVPLPSGTADGPYLDALRQTLPVFLDAIGDVRLVFYNAGTDIYEGDLLGRLQVSAEGVQQRDRYVIDLLRERGIPWVMVLSGGYSDESYRLVAAAGTYVLRGKI